MLLMSLPLQIKKCFDNLIRITYREFMKKTLVIVESPTKAKTIGKYLGRSYQVIASVGHVRDLPAKKLGVDVKKKFKPVYEIIKGKDDIIKSIKAAAKTASHIFLAPDPDREGEAIAWHIAEELKSDKKKIKRILFNEITKKAVSEAIKHPIEINQKKFESQQARRILDRLVGYQISPILWDKVRRGLSAGRVQSVALRLVVERERDVLAFKPEEYWSIQAFLGSSGEPFWAKLAKKGKEKIEINNKEKSQEICDQLKYAKYVVRKIDKTERRRNALPPFVTSRLQQDASRKLRFPAKKTMMVAQKLYEGIDIGEEGTQGLITYMRTDSTRISDDALKEVREYIKETFGEKYLPHQPVVFKTKKNSQDAHEAIRPTNLSYTPKKVKDFLSPDQYKLYLLIWNRFVACQMVPAVFDQTTIEIDASGYELRATGSIIKFDGFTAVYEESKDEDAPLVDDDSVAILPVLKEGEVLKLKELKPEQHFTQPPPRYTDASLIKDLEEKGVGRPSTYAAILSTIVDKDYAAKDPAGRYLPTDLGNLVTELLVENFKDILDVEFTASMEDQLDKIEEGDKNWVEVLTAFYGPFKVTLDLAKEKMRNIKAETTPTEHICPKCSSQMVIKWGRNGQFLACSNYPDCKSTAEFELLADGKVEIRKPETTTEICEKCSSPMIVKFGRFGKFLACSAYPECKTTKAISTGVKCPKPECEGDITSRVSKRGRAFYGCSKYPKCDFVSWDKPISRPCPVCKNPFLVEKYSKKKGAFIKCGSKECEYTEETDQVLEVITTPTEPAAG
jgi:DNA topoisomerase-1